MKNYLKILCALFAQFGAHNTIAQNIAVDLFYGANFFLGDNSLAIQDVSTPFSSAFGLNLDLEFDKFGVQLGGSYSTRFALDSSNDNITPNIQSPYFRFKVESISPSLGVYYKLNESNEIKIRPKLAVLYNLHRKSEFYLDYFDKSLNQRQQTNVQDGEPLLNVKKNVTGLYTTIGADFLYNPPKSNFRFSITPGINLSLSNAQTTISFAGMNNLAQRSYAFVQFGVGYVLRKPVPPSSQPTT